MWVYISAGMRLLDLRHEMWGSLATPNKFMWRVNSAGKHRVGSVRLHMNGLCKPFSSPLGLARPQSTNDRILDLCNAFFGIWEVCAPKVSLAMVL